MKWNIDLTKISWSIGYFSLKFTQIVNNETLMINIDESCVNRNLKIDCSWIAKRQSKEVKSNRFSESLSIIIAILNNGAIFKFLANNKQ